MPFYIYPQGDGCIRNNLLFLFAFFAVRLPLMFFISICRLYSSFPFDRTAHAGDLLARPLSGLGDLQHRIEQIARRTGDRFLA